MKEGADQSLTGPLRETEAKIFDDNAYFQNRQKQSSVHFPMEIAASRMIWKIIRAGGMLIFLSLQTSMREKSVRNTHHIAAVHQRPKSMAITQSPKGESDAMNNRTVLNFSCQSFPVSNNFVKIQTGRIMHAAKAERLALRSFNNTGDVVKNTSWKWSR